MRRGENRKEKRRNRRRRRETEGEREADKRKKNDADSPEPSTTYAPRGGGSQTQNCPPPFKLSSISLTSEPNVRITNICNKPTVNLNAN